MTASERPALHTPDTRDRILRRSHRPRYGHGLAHVRGWYPPFTPRAEPVEPVVRRTADLPLTTDRTELRVLATGDPDGA